MVTTTRSRDPEKVAEVKAATKERQKKRCGFRKVSREKKKD